MSRDHKPPRQQPTATRKSRGGTLLGIFIGLIFGVGSALAVVWYMNKTPAPFVTNKTGLPESASKPPIPAGAAPTAPAPLPGKPGDPPVEKRFTFYDILPGKTEPKPDGKPGAAPAPAPAPAPATEPPKPAAAPVAAVADTQLQAGSFQNSKDADNLKANLALSGLEAVVQQVMVGDKVWYRVRLGPYARPEDLNRARAELSKMGIESTVVKAKD
jgi:cell division protein FtsN